MCSPLLLVSQVCSHLQSVYNTSRNEKVRRWGCSPRQRLWILGGFHFQVFTDHNFTKKGLKYIHWICLLAYLAMRGCASREYDIHRPRSTIIVASSSTDWIYWLWIINTMLLIMIQTVLGPFFSHAPRSVPTVAPLFLYSNFHWIWN